VQEARRQAVYFAGQVISSKGGNHYVLSMSMSSKCGTCSCSKLRRAEYVPFGGHEEREHWRGGGYRFLREVVKQVVLVRDVSAAPK